MYIKAQAMAMGDGRWTDGPRTPWTPISTLKTGNKFEHINYASATHNFISYSYIKFMRKSTDLENIIDEIVRKACGIPG